MSVTIRRYSVDDGAEYSPSSSEGSRGCRHSSVIDAAACSSQSTAPTSVSGSPRLLDRKAVSSSSVSVTTVPLHHLPYPEKSRYRDEQSLDSASEFSDDESDGPHNRHGLDTSNRSIPPLPEYRHDIVDKYVCPSTPQEFAQLFPSLDRMSVRHDDFTTDGNMCLRVDVAVPVGSHRLLTSYQLFHLRMYDLSKREFSLRRYCRDSGLEEKVRSRDHQSNKHTTTSSRRSLSTSVPELHGRGKLSGRASLVHLASALKPTNVIKLEFSNYARVDLERRGGNNNIVHDNTRYCYEWWGHKYTWKRFIGKHLDVPSYHLLRDDNGDQPIAHIVPETRSPNQVDTDELAGGWIPPCHMWIADPSVLTAETDVAE
ncbi:hypothetical protein SEPCBS119000_006391 [Sporothrix epigloea]|uniref:Uncharacterized protein n=1 Tax=Sporothrix epigloea TaxID=1892477 RepID=A0ABP0E368_9PEZI